MSGGSLTYSVIVALLLFFILPTEIGSCSMNTFDMITLMSQNPNYQRDPCYIQWKAEQDAKLTQLWTQREQLEKSIAENDRRDREYAAQERENRHRSYLSSSKVEVKKQTSLWKVLGIIVGIIIGCCCCAACVSAIQSDDNSTTNATPNNPGESVPVLLTVVTSNAGQHTSDNNFTDVIVLPSRYPQPTDTNGPSMPRRQNSLPSYEDAIRMPSAPPKE